MDIINIIFLLNVINFHNVITIRTIKYIVINFLPTAMTLKHGKPTYNAYCLTMYYFIYKFYRKKTLTIGSLQIYVLSVELYIYIEWYRVYIRKPRGPRWGQLVDINNRTNKKKKNTDIIVPGTVQYVSIFLYELE